MSHKSNVKEKWEKMKRRRIREEEIYERYEKFKEKRPRERTKKGNYTQ